MIVIWDNGWDYDGHERLLLEVPIPGGTISETERVFGLIPLIGRLLKSHDYKDSFLVGAANAIVWTDGDCSLELANYLWPSSLFKWRQNPTKFGQTESNVRPRDEAWQLGKPFVAELLKTWKAQTRSDHGLEEASDLPTFLKAIELWVTTTASKGDQAK